MTKIGTVLNTKKTIEDNKFHIKKKFGQNFLTDQFILNEITNIPQITKETLVVEIGPGIGSMTEILLDKAKKVLAYEIDKDLIPILQNNFKNKNLTLINDDILKRNIDEDIKTIDGEFDKIVLIANLPYYITTAIVMKILEESNLISELVIMMQYEVAMRFTSKPSTKDYNSLSVVIQFKTDSKIAMKVPKSVFIPIPNVDSAVVHMKIKEKYDLAPDNLELFYKIVKKSFTQRRKTLVNNISTAFNLPKAQIIDILVDLGHSATVRGEKLSVSEFVELSNIFNREIF